MGIQLTDLVKGNEITIEDLRNRRIAIDSFNWIYQFLSIIRQRDGEPLKDSKGRVTSHISGLFYRTTKLLEANVKPVFVFDGKPPEFKVVVEKRRDIRLEAMREWKSALERKDYEAARKFAMRSSTVTEEIINGSKELLSAFGVPVIQAPSEGEALCSVMTRNGDVYATATQDYDSLLFGCNKLVRNLSITGKRKRGTSYVTVNPELLTLDDLLKNLEINQDQLIMLGILIGTDYNPGGVSGYGPKRALELVKAKKTLNEVMKELVWDFDVSAEDIFNFFKHPTVSDYKIEFTEIDENKIKKILCDEYDFSEERVDNVLKKMKREESQEGLGKFF
ncbi:MAG: flap endonuclease-1 [Candidatus Aenigmatarchaeota archaeon]